MERTRLVRVGGTLAWLAVAVPLVAQPATSLTRLGLWAIAWLAFGVALHRGWILVQTAAVIGLVLTLCDGFEGTLLVIVAMQLTSSTRRRAFAYIAAQTLLLGVAIGIHWTPRAAMLLVPPYLGFQLLAFLTIEATAQSSRMAERLRISRELHDAIGHHLTALTLNLEAALQRTSGDAHAKIEVAQSLARSLLADVREIVASMESDRGIDLARAIGALAAELPRPRVHLQIADDVRVDHPVAARTVLRCTQEIITNAARHSGAENLWIVIDVDGGKIRIRAHDDGRGSDDVADGFGLRAMRGRVEDIGGELRIDSGPGRGFDVTALVPVKS